jgi:hypothetical protein
MVVRTAGRTGEPQREAVRGRLHADQFLLETGNGLVSDTDHRSIRYTINAFLKRCQEDP